MSIKDKIDLDEARFFYSSPLTMINNSGLESFGLIKSSVDIFVYYGINEFTAEDIKELFEAMQLVRKKTGKVFVPSAKKIIGVLECYYKKSSQQLELLGDVFRVIKWDCGGYKYEIENAKQHGYI